MKIFNILMSAIWDTKISIIILGYISYSLFTMKNPFGPRYVSLILAILTAALLIVGLSANILSKRAGNNVNIK
jgi:hypothetical protein